MNHSKINLTERLRRERRWDEASRFKDEKIAALRKSGMARKDAQQAGWEAMEKKYPPLPEGPVCCDCEVPQLSEDEIGEILGRTECERPDMTRDTTWVYEHLDDPRVHPVTSPSTGAWGLLNWARKNRGKFYKTYWPKYAPKPYEAPDMSDQPPLDDDDIEKLIKRMWTDCERSIIEGTPDSVIIDVQSRFYSWLNAYDLALPSEAGKDLEEMMVGIVCAARAAYEKHLTCPPSATD